MRKRAQFRSRPVSEEPKHIVQQSKPKVEKKSFLYNRKWWIAICLVSIFLLVLFFNTYYNLTSEISYNSDAEGLDKFYLSGPDPYYNMRLIDGTVETGEYPYYSDFDPLLNYPLTARGGRAPLFNMMAIGFSKILTPFMPEVDALGYSMQFIPALFGAILIFVVYFIGKELFNYKAGLVAAMLIAFIPIHLGSGHGSAFALFDHDSFNLLLFFLTFLFLIKALKEQDSTKSMLYAILAGIPIAGLTMTWVEAQFLFVVIAVYAIIQMLIDIYTSNIEFKMFRNSAIILWTGYLISLPVISSQPGGFGPTIPLYLCIIVTGFGFIYYLFKLKRIPWTISLPFIFTIGGLGLGLLYFIDYFLENFQFLSFISPLRKLAIIIFGEGIYGNKVSMTIAEANTYSISHTVMSFGPALYWVGWAGFLLLFYYFFKEKIRREYLFIIIIFILDIYLAATAGRFLNDMVPLIAILAGWITWMFIDWIDYKQMIRNIKSAGGGIHGLRRGIKFLHVVGILFVFFILLIPNAFVAFDAAIPNAIYQKEDENGELVFDSEGRPVFTTLKIDMFGEEHRGAFGLGIGKEEYWAAAFDWLNDQDTDIKDPAKRPAFISWWDYGFYEVALGGHPTVADNFQDGIPPAANFHTATSEEEAVVVFIVRLLEGVQHHNGGKITNEVKTILINNLGNDKADKIVRWVEDPTQASDSSFGDPIKPEYEEDLSKDYTVGSQYTRNAVYHDVINLLTNETTGVSDEVITKLYHEIQEVTGWSIRYYGVEGYDKQIFNIFAFLSDQSLILVGAPEDDFVVIWYDGYTIDRNGEKVQDMTWSAQELKEMSDTDQQYIRVTSTRQEFKDPYFETMFYKTYIGPADEDEAGQKSEYDWQIPCVNMKHFYAEYLSDLSKYQYYNTGKGSVVIAKYYECAIINGTFNFMGSSLKTQGLELAVLKNLSYTDDYTYPIQHDLTTVDTNGNFSLLVGADAYLQLRTTIPIAGQNIPFIFQNYTFEGANGTDFEPITDDVAMRIGNYERHLNISIGPASVEGLVYDDLNNDGIYNSSKDTLLDNVNISVYDYQGITQGSERDSIGNYSFYDLFPSFYIFRVEQNGFIINETFTDIYSGIRYINISKTKTSTLDGRVYYNDSGTEVNIANANMDITYLRKGPYGDIEEEIFIESITTDTNGLYEFSSALNPGAYRLDVTSTESPVPKYTSEIEMDLEENVTKEFNISIDLTKVNLSGYARYNAAGLEDIEVLLIPDESVDDNTARDLEESVVTNEIGYYAVDLTPGSYNITVAKMEENTPVYSYEGNITIAHADVKDVDTKNIDLTKHSATTFGTTYYQGSVSDNVTIYFSADVNDPLTNAITANTMSDETGSYTIELAPGNYSISASKVALNETGDGTDYIYSWEGSEVITDAHIITSKPFDITGLVRAISTE